MVLVRIPGAVTCSRWSGAPFRRPVPEAECSGKPRAGGRKVEIRYTFAVGSQGKCARRGRVQTFIRGVQERFRDADVLPLLHDEKRIVVEAEIQNLQTSVTPFLMEAILDVGPPLLAKEPELHKRVIATTYRGKVQRANVDESDSISVLEFELAPLRIVVRREPDDEVAAAHQSTLVPCASVDDPTKRDIEKRTSVVVVGPLVQVWATPSRSTLRQASKLGNACIER